MDFPLPVLRVRKQFSSAESNLSKLNNLSANILIQMNEFSDFGGE